MLSGEQPFSGVPYHQIMRRVCDRREAPEVPPGLLEPELEQLLTRCVSHDPNSRPSAAEAHRAFNEMATGVVRQQDVAPRASAGAVAGMATAPATEAQGRPAAADNGAGALQRQVQPSTAGGAANQVGVGASGTDRDTSDSAMIETRAEPFAQARQAPSDPTLELLTLRIARFARAGSGGDSPPAGVGV